MKTIGVRIENSTQRSGRASASCDQVRSATSKWGAQQPSGKGTQLDVSPGPHPVDHKRCESSSRAMVTSSDHAPDPRCLNSPTVNGLRGRLCSFSLPMPPSNRFRTKRRNSHGFRQTPPCEIHEETEGSRHFSPTLRSSPRLPYRSAFTNSSGRRRPPDSSTIERSQHRTLQGPAPEVASLPVHHAAEPGDGWIGYEEQRRHLAT